MDERFHEFERAIEASDQVRRGLDEAMIGGVCQAADAIVAAFRGGGRLLTLGNGGSAADAQHFAAEMVGRFLIERPGFDAHALTVDPSVMTGLFNDYPPEDVFARQVRGHAREADVVCGISTSGNSPNVVRALIAARERAATTIGLTGLSGGEMAQHCDVLLTAPSNETPRIQECHVFLIHMICQFVEAAMVETEA